MSRSCDYIMNDQALLIISIMTEKLFRKNPIYFLTLLEFNRANPIYAKSRKTERKKERDQLRIKI